jgi:hypothetical protein
MPLDVIGIILLIGSVRRRSAERASSAAQAHAGDEDRGYCSAW